MEEGGKLVRDAATGELDPKTLRAKGPRPKPAPALAPRQTRWVFVPTKAEAELLEHDGSPSGSALR